MINLYLVRHGESLANLETACVGGRRSESLLTYNGITQSILLCQRFKKENIIFDEVYASSAERAKATSAIVCATMQYPLEKIVLCDDLQEISHGDCEGEPREKVWTQEVHKKAKSDPWNFKLGNGESQRDVEERVYGWIEKHLPNYQENKTI